MATPQSPAEPIWETEKQIAWVLAHPGMSNWLKDAFRTSADCDPADLLNDLEILNLLLRSRSQAVIDRCLR